MVKTCDFCARFTQVKPCSKLAQVKEEKYGFHSHDSTRKNAKLQLKLKPNPRAKTLIYIPWVSCFLLPPTQLLSLNLARTKLGYYF